MKNYRIAKSNNELGSDLKGCEGLFWNNKTIDKAYAKAREISPDCVIVKVPLLTIQLMEILREEYKNSPEFLFQKMEKLRKCVKINKVINFAMELDKENLKKLSNKLGFDFFEDKMNNESKQILALNKDNA